MTTATSSRATCGLVCSNEIRYSCSYNPRSIAEFRAFVCCPPITLCTSLRP